MPHLKTKGAILYYETWGEGEGQWITLVNGYSRPLTDFRAMGRFLVDKGWRVLALDNRGAGLTDAKDDFGLEEMVDDIVALWDEVGSEESHLVGISMGGMLSLAAVVRAPERVRSLILISTASCSEAIVPASSKDPEEDLRRYFSARFLARNLVFANALVKETAKVFQNPKTMLAAQAQRRAMRRFDATRDLPRLDLPVLVMHGEEDQVIPVEAGRKLAIAIPEAQWKSFSGAGHLLLAESPKELYEAVEVFCSSVDADCALQ